MFRDELTNLFPADTSARRLAQRSLTLGEFLGQSAYEPPRLHGQALMQVHCHQGAVLTHDRERALVERMGLDLAIPDSGCCGMAGGFGYERGQRYEVSQACGERVISPAVRDAPRDALIIADGFSCREQIAQATGRRPLRLAQVIRLAAGKEPRPRHTPGSNMSSDRARVACRGHRVTLNVYRGEPAWSRVSGLRVPNSGVRS